MSNVQSEPDGHTDEDATTILDSGGGQEENKQTLDSQESPPFPCLDTNPEKDCSVNESTATSLESHSLQKAKSGTNKVDTSNPVRPRVTPMLKLNLSEATIYNEETSGKPLDMELLCSEPMDTDSQNHEITDKATYELSIIPGVPDKIPQSPVIIIGEDVFQVIDDCPPPPAPFPHRFVTLAPGTVEELYSLNMKEILGGGRFGEVHVCTEKSSGMKLVAKVLKIQTGQEREMALNEVQVMNQLDHRNIIQMFDALETPSAIFLFIEYVEAGELFERIIDDNFELCEVDAMVYTRQICEGVFYMHQMYVLHLDLKPENIVCVSPISHMVKIIDFGLARKVSGLSPFLGDNDPETMNNILNGDTGFEEESFESVSDEAKDFISNLLVREKGGRMSAAQCLRHPWLNDLERKAKLCNRLLKSQLELRKYMMRRRWKKNFFAVTAANRFLKSSSSGCLSPLAE
ncbi:myosin light chain kinase 2, skeletal/cardiac muscle isoform X2 [Bombina bombina]|uniref:myosin light chain kinase 2, skeletal/cardiac muscle isoform X2 n=1 Tax=Bombina bombina TaxID=8345 RepID=UPI00235AE6C3|nr:myosin light chain kinase 2, skeletal/cardiac muscle isoform X2 [Bombina bombina]